MVGLAFAIGLLTLHAWLKALLCACEAKFIAAGVWLCVGIFMVDVLNVAFNGEAWVDFGPLYVAIMIGSVGATVLKLVLRWRRHREVALEILIAEEEFRPMRDVTPRKQKQISHSQ